MASDQETLSTSIEDYVLLQQKEQERIISEASHLLVDEDADDSAVDKIDVNSPSITASPHFYHNESKMMDPSQPLIHDRIPLNSSDDSHPFECSCSWFCRRNFLLKLFYLFLGVLAFCGLVVLADEIGVSTVETIRRYQHRTNHHTNPHQSHHSRQYPGPRYFRVPGEQQCHNEVAFYQNDEMERYGFACAVQWSYDDSTSLRLSCEEGYVLSCMFGASYGSKEPNQECSEWDTQEDMDQYPVLPESVWESDCAGHNACTLELGHVGSGENTCLDMSGVVNAYYDSVNGVEMDDLDWSAINGFKKDCQFVALKVQALCEKEVVEEEDV